MVLALNVCGKILAVQAASEFQIPKGVWNLVEHTMPGPVSGWGLGAWGGCSRVLRLAKALYARVLNLGVNPFVLLPVTAHYLRN